MSKPYFISNDPSDVDAIRAYIKDFLLQHTDPDAWATQQMFDKLRKPIMGMDDAGYDELAWDNDVWVPKGTKYIP